MCFALPGHTKGSAVFADTKHKAVLCGDAVGSGAGVWMFLPDCDNLRQYKKGLSVACEYLSEYRNYRFYGGHNSQGLEEGASPLSYNTFCDMKELCEHIISGNEFSNNNLKKIPFVNLLWFRYKTAAIVTRKGKIKS